MYTQLPVNHETFNISFLFFFVQVAMLSDPFYVILLRFSRPVSTYNIFGTRVCRDTEYNRNVFSVWKNVARLAEERCTRSLYMTARSELCTLFACVGESALALVPCHNNDKKDGEIREFQFSFFCLESDKIGRVRRRAFE